MLYWLPHPPLAFEIPDAWLAEAGATGFKAAGASYRGTAYSIAGETLVPLSAIAPMMRRTNVSRDHHGFRRRGGPDGGPGGMVDVVRAMIEGIHLPPVQVRALRGTSVEGFAYAVQDGFHRFYASHALGFTHLPCLVQADIRCETQFGDER